MEFKEVEIPWVTGKKAKIPHLVEKQINTEKDAAMRYDRKTPRYLHIASNRTNRWGHHRSYRLQVFSFTGDHLPQTEPEEKSMSWARWAWWSTPVWTQMSHDHYWCRSFGHNSLIYLINYCQTSLMFMTWSNVGKLLDGGPSRCGFAVVAFSP